MSRELRRRLENVAALLRPPVADMTDAELLLLAAGGDPAEAARMRALPADELDAELRRIVERNL
jgi:hypothetical protein